MKLPSIVLTTAALVTAFALSSLAAEISTVRLTLSPDKEDTMGAGDSYIAGFLKSILENKPIRSCMEAGAQNAGITLGYQGAW